MNNSLLIELRDHGHWRGLRRGSVCNDYRLLGRAEKQPFGVISFQLEKELSQDYIRAQVKARSDF
jgi:hypothetical protein